VRGQARLLVFIAAIAATSSCITPSIPIPPPAPSKMGFDVNVDAGTATFTFAPDSNYVDAIVYVFNRTVGTGVITTAEHDGSVTATPPFPAHYNDEASVTFEAEAQTASTCVVITANGAFPDCGF